MPLVKAMAGMMVPWSELSVIHVQSLIDKAFGENLHVIQWDDVWCGLVGSSIPPESSHKLILPSDPH